MPLFRPWRSAQAPTRGFSTVADVNGGGRRARPTRRAAAFLPQRLPRGPPGHADPLAEPKGPTPEQHRGPWGADPTRA